MVGLMAQGFYSNMNYESTKPILKFPGAIFYEAIRPVFRESFLLAKFDLQ